MFKEQEISQNEVYDTLTAWRKGDSFIFTFIVFSAAKIK